MNKNRVEAFTDGVFSIVMTLLVFNLHVPTLTGPISDALIWQQLALIAPSIVTFIISFIVLSALWMNHHFLFNSFNESLNRQLTLLNLLYLLFIAFVPFSANFISEYSAYHPADLIYGINLLCIVITSTIMANYIRESDEIDHKQLPNRLIKQARFRSALSIGSYVLGIILSFVYIPASIFFYIFPVLFNIVPGTLNLAERIFRFKLD